MVQTLYQRAFVSVEVKKIVSKLTCVNLSQLLIEYTAKKKKIIVSFQFNSCEIPEELASIPLVFEEPIYGNHQLTFTDFMAPGIILTIVHSMALGYSAMIIIMERNEGLLDRTWVAGVTPGQFALAHFLVSLVVNLLQVIVTLVFMIAVFQVSLKYRPGQHPNVKL